MGPPPTPPDRQTRARAYFWSPIKILYSALVVVNVLPDLLAKFLGLVIPDPIQPIVLEVEARHISDLLKGGVLFETGLKFRPSPRRSRFDSNASLSVSGHLIMPARHYQVAADSRRGAPKSAAPERSTPGVPTRQQRPVTSQFSSTTK
jgi:hypothetical protein